MTRVTSATRHGASPDDWTHFDLVLGLTADLLPVVSNPGATIAPDSSMRDLGKVPSRYNGARHAVGIAGWTQRVTTSAEIALWSRDGDLGICIQTRRVRALDVDVTDPDAARAIRAWLDQRLPGAPVRSRGNSSKFLIAFECEGDITKRRCPVDGGFLELLATGQQFVAVGTHPSGARYEWADGLPDAFPVLDEPELDALWADLVEAFGQGDASISATSVKQRKLADVIAQDAVAQHLLAQPGRVRRAERDGRLHILCPWADEHSSDTESATTYWPAHTGGYLRGHFACLHAHCEHRTDQDFLDAVGYREMDDFAPIADEPAPAAPAADPDDPTPIDDAPAAREPHAQKAPRFAVVPAASFAQGRPPAWIVKGVLPAADLGVIFGESGSGKSFAALDLAVDIAMGTPWRGRPTRQGKVVYIAAEGAGGFRNRLRAIAQARGIELEDLPIGVIADAPNLMERTDALDVARAIKAAGGADLVIVDTFAQVMPGANENAGEDVGRALTHAKGIRRATGAMVLLVHHAGKDSSKGARGWSGLRAAADVELEVVRADSERSITVTKQKDGEDGAEFAFRLQEVILGLDEDGEEITSCVVEHHHGGRASARAGRHYGNVERIVLSSLSDLSGTDEQVAEHADLKAEAVARLPFEAASGKRDRRGERVERAIEGLIAAGELRRAGTRIAVCS